MDRYDSWKTATPEHYDDDTLYCDVCEAETREDDFEEVHYYDADHRLKIVFVCPDCYGDQSWTS